MAQSEFIITRTNEELVEFIKVGGVPNEPLIMPPRGGSPSLTDKNLVDIVVSCALYTSNHRTINRKK
jgi:hypothetical protein